MFKKRIDLGTIAYQFNDDGSLNKVTLESSYQVIDEHMKEFTLQSNSDEAAIQHATSLALASHAMHISNNLELRDPALTPIQTSIVSCEKDKFGNSRKCSVNAFIEVDDDSN